MLLLINFGIGGCQERDEQKKVQFLSDRKKNISPVIYGINYDIRGRFKILINDEIVAKNNDDASSGAFLPFNELLLANQKTELKVRIYRSPKEKYINPHLYKDFKLTVVSCDNVFENFSNIQQIEIPHEITDKEFVEYIFAIDLKSYYPSIGWSNSEKLANENREKLIIEVQNYYKRMFNIINSGDYIEYYKVVEKREKEVLAAYFNASEIIKEQQEEENDVKEAKGKMKLLDFTKYTLKLYGNGRLVVLEDEKGNSPLSYSTNDFENFFGFVLHRPKPDAPLEIIR
jgi:hypothetical protein